MEQAQNKQELERELDDWRKFFQDQKWKDFIDARKLQFAQLNEGWHDKFKTNDELQYTRGYLKALELEVLKFEELVELNYSHKLTWVELTNDQSASEDLI